MSHSLSTETDLQSLAPKEFQLAYPLLYAEIGKLIWAFLNLELSFEFHKKMNKILNRNLDNLKVFKRLDPSGLLRQTKAIYSDFEDWLDDEELCPKNTSYLESIQKELDDSGLVVQQLQKQEGYVELKYFYNTLELLKQHFYRSSNAIAHFKATIANQKQILTK